MHTRLAELISRHWLVAIVAWIGLAAGLRWLAPSWYEVTFDGDLAYLPARMTSVRGERLHAAAFPVRPAKSDLVLVFERPGGPLTPADLAAADEMSERFAAARQLPIVNIYTRQTELLGEKLVSPVTDRGQAVLVVVRLKNEFMATANIKVLADVQQMIRSQRAESPLPAGLELDISGSAAIGGDTLTSAAESIRHTELATILLVVAILLVVYRAPLMALIPLLAIAVSVLVATDLVALLAQYSARVEWLDFKVFTTTRIFIVVILFGSGTDFCLFLISRYREEIESGLDSRRGVAAALRNVSGALAGSAATTIVGLGTMYFADFGKFKNGGPAIALCLAVTLLACLTLAPALLRLFGKSVFWPWGIAPSPREEPAGASLRSPASGLQPRFWTAVSHGIVARPGLVFVVSLLILAPFAWRGLSIDVSYDLVQDLGRDRPSVVGTRMLQRHFPLGETGPVMVLARLPGAEFDSQAGRRLINDLAKEFFKFDGVLNVRSLTEPFGDRPHYRSALTSEGLRIRTIRQHPTTKALFLANAPGYAGEVTRFDLIFSTGPFSEESVRLLDAVDGRLREISGDPSSPWHRAEFDFVGVTAGIRDLESVTTSDRQLIQRLVVLAVFAVLLIVLRRPFVSAYLILSVLLSYLVTIGATQLIFQSIYGPTYDGLDWKAPIYLFVILVAVGEDYNIYLMTRVVEEQRRHGLLEGLRLAVAKTGGIISSCGLIMAGSFLSMMVGSLRSMFELGLALTLGILLDTFVVRPVLVPSFLACVYRLRGENRHSGGEPLQDHSRGDDSSNDTARPDQRRVSSRR